MARLLHDSVVPLLVDAAQRLAEGRDSLLAEPYAVFVINARSLLSGRMRLRFAGWQSLLYVEDQPVAALEVTNYRRRRPVYAGAAFHETATAINATLEFAYDRGVVNELSGIAIANLPQLGLLCIWIEESDAWIPVPIAKLPDGIEQDHVYTRRELVKALASVLHVVTKVPARRRRSSRRSR